MGNLFKWFKSLWHPEPEDMTKTAEKMADYLTKHYSPEERVMIFGSIKRRLVINLEDDKEKADKQGKDCSKALGALEVNLFTIADFEKEIPKRRRYTKRKKDEAGTAKTV